MKTEVDIPVDIQNVQKMSVYKCDIMHIYTCSCMFVSSIQAKQGEFKAENHIENNRESNENEKSPKNFSPFAKKKTVSDISDTAKITSSYFRGWWHPAWQPAS